MKATVLKSTTCARSPPLRFRSPEVDRLQFKAGQFVSFKETLNGKEITRPYSIVSLPDGNRFELCLNLVHEGVFTLIFFTPKPGDSPRCRRPRILRDSGSSQRSRLHRHRYRYCTVPCHGPRVSGRIRMPSTLRCLRRSPRIYHLLSRPFRRAGPPIFQLPLLADAQPSVESSLRPAESAWTGHTGHVQNPLTRSHRRPPRSGHLHLWMKAMVDDVRAILKELGFDRKQIIFENTTDHHEPHNSARTWHGDDLRRNDRHPAGGNAGPLPNRRIT